MRRFVLGSGATIALLAFLLTFKTSAAPARGALVTPAHATARPSGAAHHHAATSGTATGPTESTPYGPVQVRVTVAAGRITDVVALQLPHDASYSRQLASSAVPQLRHEALQAQSARIDVVSGATYTSEGYAQSLQGALDRLGA